MSIYTFEAGEAHKRAETYITILSLWPSTSFRAPTLIVALGGGVVGDVAGFVAATTCAAASLYRFPQACSPW